MDYKQNVKLRANAQTNTKMEKQKNTVNKIFTSLFENFGIHVFTNISLLGNIAVMSWAKEIHPEITIEKINEGDHPLEIFITPFSDGDEYIYRVHENGDIWKSTPEGKEEALNLERTINEINDLILGKSI